MSPPAFFLMVSRTATSMRFSAEVRMAFAYSGSESA